MVKRSKKAFLAFLAALLLSPAGWAFDDIYIAGLFRDRAVIVIDGVRRVLSAGETSPEGVTLVSANSESAVVEFSGKRHSMTPEARIHGGLSGPQNPEVQILRDKIGMYRTVGSINGLPVSFLVDTGATLIAMNGAQARRLGVNYRIDGVPAAVSTASGIENVFQVRLKSVRVGAIKLTDVDAVVIDGDHPQQVLLGMSFLGRLEMRNDGRRLLLRKNY